MSDSMDDPGSLALSEVLDRYDLIEVVEDVKGVPSALIVRQRLDEMAESQSFAQEAFRIGDVELGYASPSPWTSWMRDEHLPELRGQQGIRMYQKMRRGDGTVRGSLRLLKTPIVSARWFVEPASDSQRDINVADFIWDNLENKLNVTFSNLLADVLLCLDYGHMVLEKVFTDPNNRVESPDGRARWKKLAPRHPLDISEWMYDANGGPDGIKMYSNADGEEIPIDISKLLIFTHDGEAGDLAGTSVLRSAYKHWYYKDTLYKIDAIQKERHGIGVPVVKLPPGANSDDKKLAEELGRNLRTNDKAHITLPANWEILFAKLEGQPVDCIKSIQHHDKEIAKNIIAPFMETGGKDDEQSMFLKSTRYIAQDIVCDIFNRHAIPQLVDFNWKRVGYPKLRARRIGEWDDMRTMSFTLRNLVGAQIITPDDELEDAVRRDLDLPLRDEATERPLPAIALAIMAEEEAERQRDWEEEQGQSNPDPTNPGGDPTNPTNSGGASLDGAGVTSPGPSPARLPRQTGTASARTPRTSAGRDGSGG